MQYKAPTPLVENAIFTLFCIFFAQMVYFEIILVFTSEIEITQRLKKLSFNEKCKFFNKGNLKKNFDITKSMAFGQKIYQIFLVF